MRQIFGPHTERVLPAWDAAAAIAADERIGSGYHVLIRPLKTVMASLPDSKDLQGRTTGAMKGRALSEPGVPDGWPVSSRPGGFAVRWIPGFTPVFPGGLPYPSRGGRRFSEPLRTDIDSLVTEL